MEKSTKNNTQNQKARLLFGYEGAARALKWLKNIVLAIGIVVILICSPKICREFVSGVNHYMAVRHAKQQKALAEEDTFFYGKVKPGTYTASWSYDSAYGTDANAAEIEFTIYEGHNYEIKYHSWVKQYPDRKQDFYQKGILERYEDEDNGSKIVFYWMDYGHGTLTLMSDGSIYPGGCYKYSDYRELKPYGNFK